MNPPFSLESWGYDDFTDGDPYDRFKPMPPRTNADYAWMQHVVKSLKPDGKAIIVMSQGILFRGQPELTEEEDGRNKKPDDEYLIRRKFLENDLIEGIVVLPSGIFYGNNVPACLAIINKRKPKARKNKVLMIWAARHYKAANPQNILRRADCLRILVPWRAFGDIEKACKLIPKEGKAFLEEIQRERERLLRDIADAYDPPLEQLPALQAEAETLTVESFKAWQQDPTADHPVWGRIAHAMREVETLDEEIKALERGDDRKRTMQGELKKKKSALRSITKEAKDDAKARAKKVKALIKALEKLEKERDERICEVNRDADRDTAEVNEAIADLERICADDEEVKRHFTVVDESDVEANEFNLNLPRYVDTFDPEEAIDLSDAIIRVQKADKQVAFAWKTLAALLDKARN